MNLRIISYKNGEITGPEYWNDYPLEAAKETVRQWVDDGVRNRVEIRGKAEDLIFQYPRVLHSANR